MARAQSAINDEIKKLGKMAWGNLGDPGLGQGFGGLGSTVTYTQSSTTPSQSYTAQQILQNK